jgi:succinate dehydrogenase / fumarate reductase cytochrome b subunit
MIGNLKIYKGQAEIDQYAEQLRAVGGPFLGHEQGLWIARIVLLVAVILHMYSAWQLTQKDNAARPINYEMRKPQAQTYASRTMRWGGVIIALFIVYHILHLTLGYGGTAFHSGTVYQNMVNGFKNPIVTAFYVIAMIALAMHLQHGLWSMFQTLGIRNLRNDGFLRGFATFFTAIIAIGNISIPVLVLAGVVH